jgi:hypothetical protein
MPPESLSWQAYFYHNTGRRDIGRPGRRWALKFFSLGAGHDSVIELATEKEPVWDLLKEAGSFNPLRPGCYCVCHML